MSEPYINHEYTPHIVCPHCGYVDDEADWDWPGFNGFKSLGIQCGSCEAVYDVTQHVSVRYSTEKTKDRPDE